MKQIYKASLVVLLLGIFLGLSGVKAQNNSLGIPDGLTNSYVTSILQDTLGYVWIGTRDGLNCYDGYQLKTYKHDPDDPHSLFKNRINCLCQDRQGNIWIGTRRGVSIYHQKKEKFYNFKIEAIGVITRGDADEIYIGAVSGNLLKLNSADVDYENSKGILSFNWSSRVSFYANHIVKEGSDVWVGTSEHGLYYVDTRNHKKISLPADADEKERVWALFRDDDKRLWCVVKNALFIADYSSNRFRKIKINFPGAIRFLRKDSKGRLYAITRSGAVHRVKLYRNRLLSEELIFNSQKQITSSLIDASDVLWLGVAGRGTLTFDLRVKMFKKVHWLSKEEQKQDITSILIDREGNRWAAMRGDTHSINAILVYYDKKRRKKHRFTLANSKIKTDLISSIYEDDQKNIWLTSRGGIYRLSYENRRKQNFVFEFMQTKERGTSYKITIAQDKYKNFWVGSWNGLFYHKNKGKHFMKDYQYISQNSNLFGGISSSEITVSYSDPVDSVLWIGSKGGGINRISQKGEKITITHYLSTNDIWSIHRKDSSVWVGTSNGLYELQKDSTSCCKVVQHYKEELPTSDVKILSIESDKHGRLWMGTPRGLLRFDPSSKKSTLFTQSDGLPGDIFRKTSCKGKDGTLFFGTNKGIIKFDPEQIQSNTTPVKLVINGLKIFNSAVTANQPFQKDSILSQSIHFTEKIDLNYQQNHIELQFAAFHFSHPEKIQYAYRLKGFDKEWIYTGADNRRASYSNLSGGNYIFQLKASNGENTWSSEPLELKIHVDNPPWLRVWAFLLYALIFLVITYLFNRYSLVKVSDKYRLQMQNMIIQKERELNEAKLKFFTNISHELRTPLTLIYGPFMDLVDQFKDEKSITRKILPIQQNINRLMRLIDQILEFRKVETGNLILKVERIDLVALIRSIKTSFDDLAEQNNIQFTFKSNHSTYESYFDTDKLDKILYNLLSNAFKYTKPGGKISIEVHLEEDRMKLSVLDNGIGIKKDKLKRIFKNYYQVDDMNGGAGIGLSLTKALVELHKGNIEVQSWWESGTEFKLEFPLGLSHYKKYIVSESKEQFVREVQAFMNLKFDDTEEELEQGTAEVSKPIVLVVDDHKEIVNYLTTVLQNDYQVYTAENGEQAYEKAIDLIPDLIISDVLMPGIDGYDLCKNVKANIKTSHVPVVLLTAKTAEESQIRGLKLGADEYVTKPFNPEILLQKIKNLLKTLQKQKEYYKKLSVTEPERIELPSKEEEFLNRLIEVIDENLSNNQFEVTNLCAEIGLSRMQLHRKLKAITGQSTSEFIRNYRFKRAAQLLESGSLNVSEVMWEVGIESNSYFSRTFKSVHGLSPSEYRKQKMTK